MLNFSLVNTNSSNKLRYTVIIFLQLPKNLPKGIKIRKKEKHLPDKQTLKRDNINSS